MDRKELIIISTLELAAEKGIRDISMQQIADKVGIKKPSLYNHFRSKEELVSEMYAFLRQRAKEKAMTQGIPDLSMLPENLTAEQILNAAVGGYFTMNKQDAELMMFYKVLYSERSFDHDAAEILAEESRRMINATKQLFYWLQVHGLLNIHEIDTAAESFALAVHGIMDYQMDHENAGLPYDKNMIGRFINWFCHCFGGKKNEKDAD